MGLCRASRYKRRNTGGRRHVHVKKRKFEMGRPAAMTKLGGHRVKEIRTMGGNKKFRALKLDSGNFSWGSEVCTRKCRILDVAYNASNNELLRTKTLVKNCIVMVDAAPFKSWYEHHYGVEVGKKRAKKADDDEEEKDQKKSPSLLKKLAARQKTRSLASNIGDGFNAGRLYACVSSRPGQVGRCDGYILEGKELDFYVQKIKAKKSKK
jgi:small subunit ribosomal protein S8e